MKHNKGTWVFCVTFTTRRGNFPLCYDINSSVVKYRWLWENWRDLSLKRDVASSFHLCYHYFTFLNVIKTRASVAIRLCNIFTVATIVHMKTNGWKRLLLQCTKDAVEKIQTRSAWEPIVESGSQSFPKCLAILQLWPPTSSKRSKIP